jgi:cytoskeletal protein CcmA (bactofilin family)
MVPFVAPAQPGFAVRPPQSGHGAVHAPTHATAHPPRESRGETPPSDGGKRLLVGRDIYLSGQITSCDRLLVEGRVEATLSDSSTIEIAESGIFKGRAEINDAEIAGRFEGDITVRGRLFIRATGRLRGKIRYGQIEIEPGGEIAGEVEVMSKAPASDFAGDDELAYPPDRQRPRRHERHPRRQLRRVRVEAGLISAVAPTARPARRAAPPA